MRADWQSIVICYIDCHFQSEQVKAHEERVLQLRQSVTEEENDVPNSKTSSKLVLSNYKEKLEHLKYEVRLPYMVISYIRCAVESCFTNTAGDITQQCLVYSCV